VSAALAPGESGDLILRVLVALALGFLIGLERGWRGREVMSGTRLAGIRTYATYGLFGGLAGVAPGDWALPAALIAAGLLVAAGYFAAAQRKGSDLGMTSEAASLATVAIGGLAGLGEMLLAVTGTVLIVLLLSAKQPLHRFLGLIRHDEVTAALKLLALSALVLPFLPNADYGPGGVLNPFGIWLAVVIVAGLSFAGYIAIRIFGAANGPLVFGLVGGLASSTAVALTSARLAKGHVALAAPFTGAIALANAVMIVRVGVFVALLAPALVGLVWPALSAAALASAIAGAFMAFSSRSGASTPDLTLEPPRDYWFAVVFGVVMVGIGLGVFYAQLWFGDAGLYAVAAVSGPFDVDAFTLSTSRVAGATIPLEAAGSAILLGVGVNTAGKAIIAWSLGGAALGLRTAIVAALTVALGIAATVLSGAL